MYLAVDPGRNIGVATFDTEGKDILKKTLDTQTFLSFLVLLDMQLKSSDEKLTIIAEDFRLRKDKALDQTGSEMPAPKVLGMLELFKALNPSKVTLHLQDPKYLTSGLKWAGNHSKIRRGYHVPDDYSAHAHGVYYLVSTGIRVHPIFAEGN